jgi:hypothetical protein
MPARSSVVRTTTTIDWSTMSRIWAGIDSGKIHHHCLVLDADGTKLLSRRVVNDEPEVLQLIADVLALADEVTWAVDMADGGAVQLTALSHLRW